MGQSPLNPAKIQFNTIVPYQ